MKMPRVSPKVHQNLSSSTRTIGGGNRSNQMQNGSQSVIVMSNGGNTGSGGSGGRNHSGQSTLPSSPNNSGPGSANSLAKSMNGSIKSDTLSAGSGGTNGEDALGIDGDNINVVVRVRPLNPKELKSNDESILTFPGDGGIWVDEQKSTSNHAGKLKPFTFNVVFEPEAKQEDILEHSGIKRLIDMAIEGFSTTCFCYGQTGSGKTHTLTGPPFLFQKPGTSFVTNADHGLIFRSFLYLFEELQKRSEDANYVIKASYLEIYNEKVIDLLNPGPKRSNLTVRWNKKSRAFAVDNLFSIECEEFDDLVAVLEEGLRNRAIGAHNMNEHSSRSHTILTVHIHSEEKASSGDNNGVFITRNGKINFVDLAGSEMTKKTKSEGKLLTEANNINKSLMVLGYCIAQLSSQKRSDKGVHIPYRDSKLTKLLADSLAGNGVTLMIACVSPAKSNLSETSNTLRYAARAKKIKTKPIIVMDPREALIVSLKREVKILEQENSHLHKLLELAEYDSATTAAIAGNGAPGNIPNQIVNGDGGRGSSSSMGSYFRGENLSDFELDELNSGNESGNDNGGSNSRPASQRSRDTLRKVSSMLFISTPATAKKIDKSRLSELDSSTLVDLIKDYMSENQDLRKENGDLFSVRDMLLRDQELVCKENERLLKKLEEVNTVCCRSPLIPVRPNYSSGDILSGSMNGSLPRSSGGSAANTGSAPNLTRIAGVGNNRREVSPDSGTQTWTNGWNAESYSDGEYLASGTGRITHSDSSHRRGSVSPVMNGHGKLANGGGLPADISKELEKRNIGQSVSNILGKNRNKGTASSSNYAASNSQWNASPSSIPRRRSGPSTLHNGSDGDIHDGFPSANRKSPGNVRKNMVNNQKLTQKTASGNKKKGANRNSSKSRKEAASKQPHPLITPSHLH